MLIGLNVTSAESYSIATAASANGEVSRPFFEILIDNFLSADPSVIKSELGDADVAFHIMFSMFADNEGWRNLPLFINRIRAFVDVLRPIYVSDHAAHFFDNGRQTSFTRELRYKDEFSEFCDKLNYYQDQLGSKVLIENFPSMSSSGRGQQEFFGAACERTQSGVLFDVSNAVVAEKNGGDPAAGWLDYVGYINHLHISGYREDASGVVIDSHDCRISDDSKRLAEDIIVRMSQTPITSIVFERDADHDISEVNRELSYLYGLVNRLRL